MVTYRHLAAIVLFVGFGPAPAVAHAFSDPQAYADPVDLGGGAGRWFTGSSADGFGCDVCHQGKAGDDLVVAGLPVGGYVGGHAYEVALSWPSYVHNLALIAEFTTEDRLGAGVLALPRPDALKPAELCSGDQAGLAPSQVNMAESMRQLISVVDCGAQTVRFQWTAPLTAAGPIWFNAGFVTSNQDATPAGDGVTLVARPLPPAGSPLATDQIAHGCSVVTRNTSARPIGILVFAAVLLSIRIRRRKECKT